MTVLMCQIIDITGIGERNMNEEREKKNILPPILLSDILLIACCAASAALFAVAVYAPFSFPAKVFVLSSSVTLVMYDLLFDAVKKLLNERVFEQILLVILAAVGTIVIGWGEAAAAAALIFRVGSILTRLLAERSVLMAESTLDIRPDVVNAVKNGAIMQLSAGKIEVGDTISVAPGEYIAFDGVVSSGESLLDVSIMSGETQPQPVSVGSEVTSGSFNLDGILNICVTSTFDDSTLSRAVKYVNDAESRKSRPEKLAIWLSGLFMPAASGIAVIIGILVPLLGGLNFVPWLGRAFGILFISSLSSQAVSIQLTYYNSIAGAIKKGILFKGADVVDTMANATSVVFDMTGILTTGQFKVTDIQANGISTDRLMMMAAYVAANANTSVMRAIKDEAGIVVDETKITDYRELPLGGYEVDIGTVTVSAGSEAFMAELGITPDISHADSIAVYIAVNSRYVGRILLTDTIRPDSKKAVRMLHSNRVDRIAMFVGDNKFAAGNVATQIGIQELYDETGSDEKIARLGGLHDMQLKGDKLIFVGAADNEPAVLKKADAGIILGGLGPIPAEKAADMIIMTDEPSKVVEAVVLARLTDSIIKQNVPILLGTKGVILILLLIGIFPVWAGVLTDIVITIGAIFNAMRANGMTRQEIKKALLHRADS